MSERNTRNESTFGEQAHWIWQQNKAWAVNYYGFFRKEFTVSETMPVTQAHLHISAYTDYTVWMNGVQIGRGPEPNDPWYQTFDTYPVATHLRPGANVITVRAHNYAVGTHWHHRNRGGLIAQLDIVTDAGTQVIATDGTWRVTQPAAYVPRSPRQWWPADFLETFDFRRYDRAWLQPSFDESNYPSDRWEAAEVLGPVGTRPWARLLPRDIPLLRETPEFAVAAEAGRFTLPRLHAVSFGDILPTGGVGIMYAEGVLNMDTARDVVLHMECDDAFKLFVNGTLVAEQNYSEFFAATRVWRGKDEYDQIHDGMGHGEFFIPHRLPAGKNRLMMVVDAGPGCWGFLLAVREQNDTDHTRNTSPLLDIPIRWTIAGTQESSGLWDSMDSVIGTVPADLPRQSIAVDPERTVAAGVTDHATIMGYESRSLPVPADPQAAITLQAGDYAIWDMGKVTVGFPTLTLTTDTETVLDIGYSQSLRDNRRIEFSNAGRMKCVDRVFLTADITDTTDNGEYQPALRRTLRYLHISCRVGCATVRDANIHRIGYPVEELGTFECSDDLLNRIYETGIYTMQLLMQQGWQDCLKREQGTLNTSSFNYASKAAACAFGDMRLARKNIRQALRTRQDSGWFDSHGISSPNSDEPTECLWLAVWLRDYLLYSGDREFVQDAFDAIEDNLRYWHKGINRHGLLEGRNRPLAWRGQGIYLDDSQLGGNYGGLFAGELSGLNMLYCAAMAATATMAAELGLAERATYWGRRAERVQHSLQARYWDDERGLYHDWREGDTMAQTYHPVFQITALHFRLGDDRQQAALLRYLTDDLGLPDENRDDYPLFTFGYYHYFLECLFRNHREAEAYALLRRFYGRWLALGGTAFGEFFALHRFRGQSRMTEEGEIHAYGLSAQLHFTTNILGVQPTSPGFSAFRVAPKPGDLQWARGSVATPQGNIGVAWEQGAGAFHLNITHPVGCECHWEVPAGRTESHVVVNGVGQG